MKGNLLLLKDLLEHWKIRFTNIWQLCQKSVYFDVLDDIIDKYNNTRHKTIKMKHTDVKSDSYAECDVGSNDEDPKFKIIDRVRISKYKTFSLRYILLIGQKKFLS